MAKLASKDKQHPRRAAGACLRPSAIRETGWKLVQTEKQFHIRRDGRTLGIVTGRLRNSSSRKDEC